MGYALLMPTNFSYLSIDDGPEFLQEPLVFVFLLVMCTILLPLLHLLQIIKQQLLLTNDLLHLHIIRISLIQ